MKILITGSEGFIGSHLTEELVRQGHDVRAFVLYNSFNSWGWLEDCDDEIREKIEIYVGDILDLDGSLSFRVINVDTGNYYIYVSTDNGRLIVIKIETGKIDKILKNSNSGLIVIKSTVPVGFTEGLNKRSDIILEYFSP